MSHPWFAVSAPPTAAPMPANAICPRLTCPAQPVSTTSESPTMPKITMTAARLIFDSLSQSGRARSRPRMRAPRAQRTYRTSGMCASSRGHRSHFTRGLPGRDVAAARSRRPLGDEQRDQDDDEEDRVVERGAVPGLERHRLIHHADADRRDRDRRQPFHAADDRGGERLEQEARAEHLADRQADDAGTQEHRDVREDAGDHPDDRVEAADGNAERQGPVAPLGRAADRDAEVRVAHEQAETDEADRHDDRGEEVGRVERHARHGEAGLERRVEAGRDAEVAEEVRQEERGAGEHLRDTDRRDRDDEARGLVEAADDQRLDEDADEDRRDEPDDRADDVVPAPAQDEQDRERRGELAEIAGGEVDDPVGPVDERDAEGDERHAAADERAVDDDPERSGERPDQDREGEDGERDRPAPPLDARRGWAARVPKPPSLPVVPPRGHWCSSSFVGRA